MLVRRVLQIAEPVYRCIIQTGTNQFGETITSPVDGIGRDGNRYVLLESTTTDKKKLQAKWLAPKTKSGEGDLLKAGREAETIRNDNSAALVTVVMATNEPVDTELFLKVHQQGDALGLSVDIWDQSRIANVLDTNPAGQALRYEYLGVRATLVSHELLALLAGRSAEKYAGNLLTGRDAMPRALAGEIRATLGRSDASLRLLRGSSGLGKSTAAHHVMRQWIAGGGMALWVPEMLLQSGSFVEDVLETTLTPLNGGPLIDAAESLLALVEGERPLLLVVDDIRHLDSPGAALRKLIAWSKPLEKERPRIVFVVPVWPQMTDEVSAELSGASWIDIVEVGPYTRAESVERLKAVPMSAADAETFAALLGDDPFLVGRWTDLVRRGTPPSTHLARNVLTKFVQDGLLQSTGTLPLLDVEELKRTLVRLSRWMMEMRETHPSASMLRHALTEREAQIVATLAGHTRVLTWRTDADGRRTIAFRHDRLEDHFFAQAAAEILRDGDPAHVISDPYFARAIGMALAAGAIQHLPRIATESPLAMFESLRFTSDPGLRRSIAEAASNWLAQEEPHFELQRAILHALQETEGEDPRALAEQLPERAPQQLVRLHHGDASAALPILSIHEFLPAATYKAFEKAVEHARSHHRVEMIDGTKVLLEADETALHGLQLAGYLALPELGGSILECWERSSKEYEITIAALWAAARCCDTDTAAVVKPIFNRYLTLAEKRADTVDLRLAFKLPPSPSASAAMVKRATAGGKDARWHTLWVLQRIDHPDLFRMYVEDAEERPSIANGIFVTDAHPSSESREMLRTLWQDPAMTVNRRNAALRVWAATATPADIPALRDFADDPVLGKTITRIRTRLGDRSAAPALAHLGMTDAGSLVWAHRIWSPELRATVEMHLKAFGEPEPKHDQNDPHHIARVLRHIPVAEAEDMLEAHWEGLRTSPLFIQSAIVISTPRTLTLAKEAVDSLPADQYAFRHMSDRFGLWHTEDHDYRGAVPETVLTTRHLAALAELAPAMRRKEIEDVLSAAERRGWFSWLAMNLESWITHLSEEERTSLQSRYHPSDNDLRAELFEWLAMSYLAHSWVRALMERGIEPRRIVNVAVSAADEKKSNEAWEWLITVLAHVGTRADLTRIEPLLPADDILQAAFDDIAFGIRRRTLQ